MKNLKKAMLLAVITISITAAIASVPEPSCLQQQQFYRMNTPWGCYFLPAGQLGVDYTCEYSPFTACSYYRVQGTEQFFVCQQGQFVPLCY